MHRRPGLVEAFGEGFQDRALIQRLQVAPVADLGEGRRNSLAPHLARLGRKAEDRLCHNREKLLGPYPGRITRSVLAGSYRPVRRSAQSTRQAPRVARSQ